MAASRLSLCATFSRTSAVWRMASSKAEDGPYHRLGVAQPVDPQHNGPGKHLYWIGPDPTLALSIKETVEAAHLSSRNGNIA
jgi:hypothetical protein